MVFNFNEGFSEFCNYCSEFWEREFSREHFILSNANSKTWNAIYYWHLCSQEMLKDRNGLWIKEKEFKDPLVNKFAFGVQTVVKSSTLKCKIKVVLTSHYNAEYCTFFSFKPYLNLYNYHSNFIFFSNVSNKPTNILIKTKLHKNKNNNKIRTTYKQRKHAPISNFSCFSHHNFNLTVSQLVNQ